MNNDNGRTKLLVGTKRGLFIARSDSRREQWTVSPPQLAGREVYCAFVDARTGTAWAATDHPVWGAHVHRSDDGGENWETLESAPHHSDARGLKAIWQIAPGPVGQDDTLYAGIEPAGLFVTRDRGVTWEPFSALNDHPTSATWQPAGGGLALGSIQQDPHDPKRVYCALSAGGVYRTTDGGESWSPCNQGVRVDFQPTQYPATGQCVHRLRLHPSRPGRLFMQTHSGVYRSDDGADTWIEITNNLPSEFGYALALDPLDPDVAYVIPEESSHMRTTVGGKVTVYRTNDAGNAWSAMRRGLPQDHAYVSILRDAMDSDNAEPCGAYFGTSSGHLFASRNRGESWRLIAGYLPRILCVTTTPG